MTGNRRSRGDRRRIRSGDRGVSTAVTHVLAIGITAILISGLLVAAGGLLNDQKENAANQELRTIGNRIATQVAVADQMVDGSGSGESVVFFIDQPDQVAGSSYTVTLNAGQCDPNIQPGATVSGSPSGVYCLSIEHPEARNSELLIPVRLDNDVTVSLESLGDGEFRIEASSLP